MAEIGKNVNNAEIRGGMRGKRRSKGKEAARTKGTPEGRSDHAKLPIGYNVSRRSHRNKNAAHQRRGLQN